MSETVDIAIIGAGFSGLGIADPAAAGRASTTS